MKSKYITQSDELYSKLIMIGFKRKGHVFFKENGTIRCELGFSHSVHQESHVKYYTITVLIEYLDVREISKKIDVTIGGFGINIGHLSENNYFKEWKVPNDSTDIYVSEVISDMYKYILNYAIPYFKRYSDIRNVIADMELNILANQIDTHHYLPIMYYISGESKKACIYLENRLNQLKIKAVPKAFSDESFVNSTYGIEADTDTIEKRTYLLYKDFACKLTELIRKSFKE